MVKVIAGILLFFGCTALGFSKHQAIRTDERNWKTRWN